MCLLCHHVPTYQVWLKAGQPFKSLLKTIKTVKNVFNNLMLTIVSLMWSCTHIPSLKSGLSFKSPLKRCFFYILFWLLFFLCDHEFTHQVWLISVQPFKSPLKTVKTVICYILMLTIVFLVRTCIHSPSLVEICPAVQNSVKTVTFFFLLHFNVDYCVSCAIMYPYTKYNT